MNSSTSTFVGRQPEMAELKAALEDVLAGQGRLVMLVGEPGIGKTRTAQELAALAQQKGAEVLWGRCHEERGAPPYWPWVQVIRSYVSEREPQVSRAEMGAGASQIAEIVAEVKERLPDLQPSPPVEDMEQARFRLFDSITTFLKRASHSQPLVIVLDNLHWADPSSLRLLEFVAPELSDNRLLLLGTYRDAEVSRRHPLFRTLGELTRQRSFHRLALSGLSQEDVGRVIELTGGIAPPQELVAVVHQQTEGNPLFVREVVRLLKQEGVLAEGGGVQLNTTIRIPEGVREVISRRLEGLSEGCNEVLAIASVVGREFSIDLLEGLVVARHDVPLVDMLEEALAVRVIEELPGRVGHYQFTHALVQRVIVAELSTTQRVRMHALIAEALEERYGAEAEAHAAELVYHYAEAQTLLGTEKLAQYSLMAGERALSAYAYEDALAYFERALATKEGQPMNAEYATLLFRLARTQSEMRRLEDAWTNYVRALEYFLETGNVPQAIALAAIPLPAWEAAASREEGAKRIIALMSRTLELASPNSREAGRLLSTYGWCLGMGMLDCERAQETFEKALAIARRQGDTALEMRTLANAASVAGVHLRWRDALDYSLAAIQRSENIEDLESEARARYRASEASYVMGDLGRAVQHATAGLGPAEKLRHSYWMPTMYWTNEVLYRLNGDWARAREFSDRALTVATAQMNSYLLASRAELEFQLGNFAQARAYLDGLLDSMRSKPQDPHVYPALLISLMAPVAGVSDLLDIARFSAEANLTAIPNVALVARVVLAMAAVHQGDVDAAGEQYAALEQGRGTMLVGGMICLDRVLGRLSVTLGESERGQGHFEDALAFCRRAGYRPEYAWAACDYADALLAPPGGPARVGPRRREKAISLLAEALGVANELGMAPLSERLTRLKSQAKPLRPLSRAKYPAGLTQREVEVLRLIAAGMTNQEIAAELVIKPDTVAGYNENIYYKTGSANRAEAVAFAARHGLLP